MGVVQSARTAVVSAPPGQGSIRGWGDNGVKVGPDAFVMKGVVPVGGARTGAGGGGGAARSCGSTLSGNDPRRSQC